MIQKSKKTKTSKIIDWICGFLVLAFLTGIGTGFYFRIHEKFSLGDKFIGSSILGFVLVLLPIFLVHRWRGKRLKDYTLTKENIKRIRDKGID